MKNPHPKVILFSFLGAISWFVHFLLIYAFGEFGCISDWDLTALSIALTSLALFIVGLYSIYECHKYSRWPARIENEGLIRIARLGIISNSVFTFIIVFETIPLFFFQGKCF